MAQTEDNLDDDNEHEEAEELERLLEDDQNGGVEAGEEGSSDEAKPTEAGPLGSSKKKWILMGGGAFLIILLAGGAYFFLLSPTQIPEGENQSGEQADQKNPATPPVKTVKSTFSKVHIYSLKPFFLPLKENKKDTGKFISVTPNLVLSNSTLSKEIENSLPAIRKNIYNILTRKSPREYFSSKRKIEEKIKKDILTTVNPILLAGTGSVTDVAFTQFVVK